MNKIRKVNRKANVVIGTVAVFALLFVFALNWSSPSQAADKTQSELFQENQELKQLLQSFGKGKVDIYAALEDVKAGKPAFSQVKMMRPVTTFGKHFYRAKDTQGNVWLISPAQIAAIKVGAGNF